MVPTTSTGFSIGNGDESPPCGTVRKRRGGKAKINLSTASGGLRPAFCSTATAVIQLTATLCYNSRSKDTSRCNNNSLIQQRTMDTIEQQLMMRQDANNNNRNGF
jgi:hypothetical protein